MKVLFVNGSSWKKGCTDTALREVEGGHKKFTNKFAKRY